MFTVKTVWCAKCKTRENTKTSSCCIVFIIMLWSLTNLQEELWAVKICTSPENCLLFKAFVKMLDAASSHCYYVRKTMNFKVVFNHFPNLLSFLAFTSPKYNASITKPGNQLETYLKGVCLQTEMLSIIIYQIIWQGQC